MRTVKAGPTRSEALGNLPEPIPGESLVKRLRRCTGTLSLADAARLLGKDRTTVHRAVKKNKIPTINVGLGENVIDPAIWADQIELRNPNICVTARKHLQLVERTQAA